MLVSQFELLFKSQAPAPANGAPVDRVVQGYFLEITNLEAVEYLYQLEFVMSPPSTTLPQRSLAGNTLYLVDTPPGTDNQAGVLNGTIASSVFRPSTGYVRIPPNGTALVAVVPSIFGSAFDPTPITTPDFEVRGHVVLRLPALLRFFPFPPRLVPQSPAPVSVMLTAQNRATFFSASDAITGQVQASLPLANGTAVNLLPPEPGGPFVFPPVEVSPALEAVAAQLLDGSQDPGMMLAALLSAADPDPDAHAAFNASLAAAGIAVGLARQD